MKRALYTLAIIAVCSPALAWSDLRRMDLATNLGDLLGSEHACGLHYDQGAIARYIDAKVPAEDMAFASMLDTMAAGTTSQILDMTESQKTAHCHQTMRAAKAHGFIAE